VAGGMVDTWPILHPGDPGFTSSLGDDLNDPPDAPEHRIDMVMFTGDVTPASLTDRERSQEPNRVRLWPSDHLATWRCCGSARSGSRSDRVRRDPGQHLDGVPVGREHRVEHVLDPGVPDDQRSRFSTVLVPPVMGAIDLDRERWQAQASQLQPLVAEQRETAAEPIGGPAW
jgi:hypothetical protein